MDEYYRKLERQFHANRDYETACKLIHLDYSLGNWRLREQANKLDISYEDAWDCANYYNLGFTQSLVDATNTALAANSIIAWRGREATEATTGVTWLIDQEMSSLYTNRSGPNTLLREATTLAKANQYIHTWKNVRVPNISGMIPPGPDHEIDIHLDDDPIRYDLPTLKFLGIPHRTGATHTAAIYIRELVEIPKIIYTLVLISIIIHTEFPHTWTREYNLDGNNHHYIDDVEEILRTLAKNINR